MGTARFLVENLITSDTMLTVSSERAGQVGLAVKVGSGTATLNPGGPFTGASPRQYIVEIDDVSAGNNVGSATFRWRPADVAAWSASGVVTATAPTVLEDGITVAWTSGGGTDFIAGDHWTITVDKAFGKAKLLDRDRDTEWRSADVATPVQITVDLGAGQTVDAVAILDTNLRATSSVSIFGADSLAALFGSTPYGVETYGTGPYGGGLTPFGALTNGVNYLTGDRTYRYWGLQVTDTDNPDGYLRIGGLYLGTYVAFTREFAYGWSRARNAAVFGPSGALRTPRGVWATAETIDLQYRLMTPADRDKVLALFDHLYSADYGTVRPIIVNLDPANVSDVSLYELDTPSLPVPSPVLDRYEWSLRLAQRPRLMRSGA